MKNYRISGFSCFFPLFFAFTNKMDDLKDRFNPRSEEEGLKLEAEETAKKEAEKKDVEPSKEPENGEKLASLISGLDIKPESKDTSPEASPKEGSEDEPSLIKSTYEVKVKLADLQADPNSPLYSAKSFEELGL